jgi:hypothetical protein
VSNVNASIDSLISAGRSGEPAESHYFDQALSPGTVTTAPSV